MKYDVFISYSRRDYIDENKQVIPGNIISQIKDLFDKNGISYWFDENGVYSGDAFAPVIARNIKSAKIFLFVSSEHSNTSEWTSNEIATAHAYKKKIIPFRYDESVYNDSVIIYIANLDYIEYFANPKHGISRLLSSVQTFLKEESEREERRKQEEVLKREYDSKIKEIKEQLCNLEHEKTKITNERLNLEKRLISLKEEMNNTEKSIKELTHQLSVLTTTSYNDTAKHKIHNKLTISDWIVIVCLSYFSVLGLVPALTLWIINSVRRSKGKDYLINPKLPLYIGIGCIIFSFAILISTLV